MTSGPARRLARIRRGGAAVLWIERLLPALAPSAAIGAAFLGAALLGAVAWLPPLLHAMALGTVAVAVVGLAVRRLLLLAPPRQAEVDRRLEHVAGEVHRPIATLTDRPAWEGSEAVWRAHRDRARARVATLRAGAPRLRWKLRAGLAAGIALLVACVWSAGAAGPARLAAAFDPGRDAPDEPVQAQAWVVPPSRTGLPAMFLQAGDARPRPIPVGSRLTVSVVGGTRRPRLVFADRRATLRRLDRISYQADLVLLAPGTLELWRGRRIGRWRLDVAPDRPPVIQLTGEARTVDGRAMLPWRASDDFGLANVAAVLVLNGVAAAALTVDLPLDGRPAAASGTALPDLIAHPWAGLPVSVHLVATDIAGQRGSSATVVVTLPERRFLNPAARQIVAVRRGLVLDPHARALQVGVLDRLSGTSADTMPTGLWLNLRAATALLAEPAGHLEEVQARLWQLAVGLEDQGAGDAKQRLDAARAALRDALAQPSTAAQQARIAGLMRGLQSALRSYLQAMARQAQADGPSAPLAADTRKVDAGQLQEMVRSLADAAAAGRTADAESQLDRLGALLDSLRPGTAGHQASGQPPGNPALERLLRDQSNLDAHAIGRLSAPRSGAQAGEARGQRGDDAAAERALRGSLGELAQHLGEATGQVPNGLARADGAMRDAAGALSSGDDAAAQRAEQRALEGLREAGQERGAGPGGGSAQQQAAPDATGQDPFGRAAGAGSSVDDARGPLPADGAPGGVRALRDEVRRRAANRTRPQMELNYLQRLLNAE